MRAAMTLAGRRKYPLLQDSHIHAERAARGIWAPEQFAFERKAPLNGKWYRNEYVQAVWEPFLDPVEDEVIVTGPASSAKTYGAAALALMLFYSNPSKTSIMISSTSGSGAEKRTWDAVKSLHTSAKFSVGRIIDYDHVLTLDETYELTGKKDRSSTAIKNGIAIVLLPRGNDGMNAAEALIGIKNKLVVWIVDELPHLALDILSYPIANLRSSNEQFKLLGLGNAKPGRNPHRDACAPVHGWSGHNSYNQVYGGRWRTKRGGICVFLSGWRSPNMHPELLRAKEKSELPFPYLSNHIGMRREAIALSGGQGWEKGAKSAAFGAMCVGEYVEGGDSDLTVLTDSDVPLYAREDAIWGPRMREAIASLDPAFTGTGDSAVLTLGILGWEMRTGKRILQIAGSIELYAEAGVDYKTSIAKQVVEICRANGVLPACFGMDISADGGTLFRAIAIEWGTAAFLAISSMEKPSRDVVSAEDLRPCCDVYDRKVTELWMRVRTLVITGTIRGWSSGEAYARDFFTRKYYHKTANMVSIETKKEMKNGRGGVPGSGKSPDHGDSLAYLCEVARTRGLVATGRHNTPETRSRILGKKGGDDPYGEIIIAADFT